MRITLATFLVTFATVAVVAADPSLPNAKIRFAPPVKIESAGGPIDVEIGHAAPFFGDFDGDGLSDLLVGQFGDGKLRIYKNVGTVTQPKFADYKFFQAGGQDATVPYG
jgi:hypothetical protein